MRWPAAGTSGCAAHMAPDSPGCTRTCWTGCARSRRIGWRCRPGAGWTRCATPTSGMSWGSAHSTCSARRASPPPCRGSPRWSCSWIPASSRIAAWDQHLADRLLRGIDASQYQVISPASGPARSTLVVLSRTDGTAAQRHRQLAEAGVDTAFREGNLRLSVHLFNTPADVDQALAALHAPPHDY